MVISKWALDFKTHQESTIVPVWVSFPALPLSLFNKKYISKLASLLGRSLRVDSTTLKLKRPSVAQVMIKMDIAHQPPKRIWIGDD